VFGYYDDIGGVVFGFMFLYVMSVFEEGFMVLLIWFWDVGVFNEVVLWIMMCNLCMFELFVVDLDVECSVCFMGVWCFGEFFDCYGVMIVEVVFDVIFDNIMVIY